MELATTTTSRTVSPQLVAVVQSALVEWNSGDTERWRNTFAQGATRNAFGQPFSIDDFKDEYEFFTALGEQTTLGECFPADSTVGESIQCNATSSNKFTDLLNMSPLNSEHRFVIVDGMIVTHIQNYSGASAVRSAWGEFSKWALARYDVDFHGFPGDADSAALASGYMDSYFDDD